MYTLNVCMFLKPLDLVSHQQIKYRPARPTFLGLNGLFVLLKVLFMLLKVYIMYIKCFFQK